MYKNNNQPYNDPMMRCTYTTQSSFCMRNARHIDVAFGWTSNTSHHSTLLPHRVPIISTTIHHHHHYWTTNQPSIDHHSRTSKPNSNCLPGEWCVSGTLGTVSSNKNHRVSCWLCCSAYIIYNIYRHKHTHIHLFSVCASTTYGDWSAHMHTGDDNYHHRRGLNAPRV